MLRLLRSIFGYRDTKDETSVRNALDRVVDGTDPWLRAVRGYRKKLRPSVLHAMEYVAAMVDALPPPLVVSMGSYRDDPRLKAFFLTTQEMREVFGRDRRLSDFLRGPGAGSHLVTALLFMDKKEKRVLGVEMAGDRIMLDVPQVTVCFDCHRLMDPAGDEGETRLRLKKRAFEYLIRVARQRIYAVKAERQGLEHRKALFQAKIDVLRRRGMEFTDGNHVPDEDIGGLDEICRHIEAQIKALGSDDGMLGSYLDMVIDVLGRPEEHLLSEKETLILDSLGIKREQASSIAPELTITTLRDTDGHLRVAQLISLPGEVLRDLACSNLP